MPDKLTVKRINMMAQTPEKFISLGEKEFDGKIAGITAYAKKSKTRFIFLSGPTSSGKTTFTKKMAELFGGDVLVVSLDDYYKPNDLVPRNKDGSYNYETVNAINTNRFADDMRKLAAGEETTLPMLDFETGERLENNRSAKLKDTTVVIIEGLHALNPKIYGVCGGKCLKIFISPMRRVYNGKKIISSYDIRFIRRMVRDNFFRNAGLEITLSMWQSVRAGEKIYMERYKQNADFLIDTFVPYELCAMKDIALAQLKAVERSRKIARLINIMDSFESIDTALIPETSILNEFIKL